MFFQDFLRIVGSEHEFNCQFYDICYLSQDTISAASAFDVLET